MHALGLARATPDGVATSLRLFGDPPAPPRAVPAWAAKGFRPFFLLAGVFATLIVPVWLLALSGVVQIDGAVDPAYWHAHEMVFGFAVAVIAGFLLTAVANWTGRETATGVPLVLLVALWALGRAAFAASAVLPKLVVAAVDVAFLPALAVAIGRPILAAKNYRNLPILGMVALLWLANLAMHAGAVWVYLFSWRRASTFAVDLVTLLILFMTGRVLPMFTRNGTGIESIRNVPALDRAAVGSMAALAAADLALPNHAAGAGLAAGVAALALVRSATWGAQHSRKVPLLWILHVGHAWIVVGLVLRAASALTRAVPPSSALHALTAGAIGCTTLGMMARVSLGHTGRPLVAPRAIAVAFGAVTLAACVRVFGPFAPTAYLPSVHVAGTLWTLAFGTFVLVYARILVRPRADGKHG